MESSILLSTNIVDLLISTIRTEYKGVNNSIQSILNYLNSRKEIKFPIIINNNVYFVFHGKANLVNVVGDFNSWDSFDKSSEMIQIGKSDFFYLQKEFEMDARLDYQFVVDTKWILDPLNNNQILGGFGYNSELIMTNYQKDNQYLNSNIPQGTIQTFNIKSTIQNGWKRRIYIYLPAGYHPQSIIRYPSVYAVDGTDYLGPGSAFQILNYYIYKKIIPPVIVIFIDPLAPSLRLQDFGGSNCSKKVVSSDFPDQKNICREKYCDFVIKELIPFIDNNFNTIPSSQSRAHVGVSLGGFLSFFIAYRNPKTFSRIGSQSGAFWIDTSMYQSFQNHFDNSFLKFYLNSGTYENRNFIHTQKLASILRGKNCLIKDEYYHQGHSWGLWKTTFGKMLAYLFNDE